MLYFISDTHFHHKNIIKYCGRPEDHNDLILENLKVVGSEDTLVHLGDVAFTDRQRAIEIVDELPGAKKILVMGNHDKHSKIGKGSWTTVFPYRQVVYWTLEGKKFALSHRPEELNDIRHVDVVLHGHIHDEGEPYHWRNKILWVNLCVEQWNYRPVSLTEILSLSGVNGSMTAFQADGLGSNPG